LLSSRVFLIQEMSEGDLDHLGDLVGRRPEVGTSIGGSHDGINAVVARRYIERSQLPEHPHLSRCDVDLFRGLSQRRFDWAFILVHLPAGKGNLGSMVGHLECPAGQDERKAVIPGVDEDEHCRPQARVSGFLIGLIAWPRIRGHLKLGLKPGLLSSQPPLERVEVQVNRPPLHGSPETRRPPILFSQPRSQKQEQ
jgi:hypothetical protein